MFNRYLLIRYINALKWGNHIINKSIRNLKLSR